MKRKTRIADDIAQGLNEIIEFQQGKRKLRRRRIEIAPVPNYRPKRIKTIREQQHLTQMAFALALGVSIKTVEAWEAGSSEPLGPARRLLWLLEQDNTLFEKYHVILQEG